MIKIFRSFGGYVELPQAEKGCWINVTNPTPDEITALRDQYNMPDDIIKDILDVDERPRLENDDDWSLVILRIPIENPNNGVAFLHGSTGRIHDQGRHHHPLFRAKRSIAFAPAIALPRALPAGER
ncbi:CorA family divalent cation transporter [Prolixibacter bellariivorans]|uniref:CorA family divalent cation transporter n=1 Tax=Prolixibacter bellariivorans TaxID=314319 RepID=UPI0021D3782F|nr:CorA family divalent cation transporter [Prolixibacter bellariivorans]